MDSMARRVDGRPDLGVSSALHEATEIDPRAARYVNNDIAEYLIPVNADVAQVDVILVPEVDPHMNPVGVKGLGELGKQVSIRDLAGR